MKLVQLLLFVEEISTLGEGIMQLLQMSQEVIDNIARRQNDACPILHAINISLVQFKLYL